MVRNLSGVFLFAVVSCTGGSGSTAVLDPCQVAALPVQGEPNAPTVTDVALELQPTVGVVLLATAIDPQGTDNLVGVLQTIGVFPDNDCEGSLIVVHDDLAGSGVEESFGTVIPASNQALFDGIAGATDWPVEIEFRDLDGHETSARVRARIVH